MLENVTPEMLDVMVALPPSSANVGADAVIEKVPESPGPVLAAPDVESTTVYVVATAPAAVAIAIGSAAAASKAPAARAFTKWRCIRLGLFIVN
jgi:hypothetical protein